MSVAELRPYSESNAFAREKLDYILYIAQELEDFFSLQLQYIRTLEHYKGERITLSEKDLKKLRRDIKTRREQQPFASFDSVFNHRCYILGEHYPRAVGNIHGFTVGALAMARVYTELAGGPLTDAPITLRRLKRVIHYFPSYDHPSFELDELEKKASAIPSKRRKDELLRATLNWGDDTSFQMPPGYEQRFISPPSDTNDNREKPSTNNRTNPLFSLQDDNVAHIASYLCPFDILSMALTCVHFGLATKTGEWSLMEEVARVAVKKINKVSHQTKDEGESWIGVYFDCLQHESLRKRNDYLVTKVKLIENWASSPYIEGLYFGGISLYKEEIDAFDDDDDMWYFGVHGAWRSMQFLFRNLASIKIPNESLGEDSDDSDWWEIGDVENQRYNALNEFPFLDT